jgi:hypothetical protein
MSSGVEDAGHDPEAANRLPQAGGAAIVWSGRFREQRSECRYSRGATYRRSKNRDSKKTE